MFDQCGFKRPIILQFHRALHEFSTGSLPNLRPSSVKSFTLVWTSLTSDLRFCLWGFSIAAGLAHGKDQLGQRLEVRAGPLLEAFHHSDDTIRQSMAALSRNVDHCGNHEIE